MKSDCDFTAMGALIIGMNVLATGYIASVLVYALFLKLFS